MKFPLVILRLTTLLSLLVFSTGCHFFPRKKTQDITPYQTYIAQNRFQTIQSSGKFICLVDQERQPAIKTIQSVIKLAEQSALSVEFRNIPGTLRIPALLRSGMGDLAVGNYTVKDGRDKQLDVVKIGDAVCLLRQNDPEWKKILLQGAALIAEENPPDKKMTALHKTDKQSNKNAQIK